MTFKKGPAVGYLVTLVMGFALAFSASVLADRHNSENRGLPVDEMRMLAEVIDRIKTAYVEEVDDRELIENAIKGMLTGLDPHSDFLPPEAFADLQESTTGQFGGLGIEVTMEDGFVRVVSPIDDTPAFRAGIQAGDLITKLDDTPVQGLSLSEAVELMRGEPGSSITLTVVREGQANPFELTIERAVIRVTSVRSRMLEPGFASVRISSFQQNTAADVVREINRLREEANGELRGLVLDLRNNPGGLLSASVDVSDIFLSDKLVVYTESRIPNNSFRYQSRRQTLLPDLNLVVLINGGSASASEIVAGALQDHKRAVIMGTQSFGKGSVQTIMPLSQDSTALKLTTARYFTPSGTSIQGTGITPDILVDQGSFTAQEVRLSREADLQGALQNGQAAADDAVDNADDGRLRDQDYQMYEALNMLKGLAILKP
ncbi:S41 family peptidase [Salinispirillum marinum]|uniref:S41 family peptidase n=2 Tax=Saccharospirillaceae TaxID=255527 RepID=A0ABV8BB87_9GAMM